MSDILKGFILIKTTSNSLNKKIESYRRTFRKYGIDPRALQWASKKDAEVRYRELVAELNFEGRSLLDVGCGFGDIIPFISEKTKNFKYTGVDLVPEFIEVAKKKYLQHKFLVRDYFGNPMDELFDVVISSGTLNANIKSAFEYRKKAIEIMFNHARQALAFNMAGGHPQPKNIKSNKVHYVDSFEILKYSLTISPRLIFRHHYRLDDFTIVMFI